MTPLSITSPLMAPQFTNNKPIFILLFIMLVVLSSRPVTAQSPPPPSNSRSQYGYFSPGNFMSSMIIIAILLITAFFVCGFFSIFLRRWSGEYVLGAGSAMQIPGINRQPRGLDQAILAKFPIMVYSEVKEHKVGKRALECAVCLSEFEDDDKLRLLPKCSHAFHPDCIDAWLAGHVTCPVCRCNLTDGDVMLDMADEIIQQAEDRPVGPVAASPDHAVVEVQTETEEERRDREDATELERIRNMRRAVKSKSNWRPPRFPRSHSTGHSLSSLSLTGEDHDRYTLRIPEHVLRQIITEGKLKRSMSLVSLKGTGEDSSRPGYKGTGEGSSRGGRSIMMFVRDISERFSSWGIGRRGNGEGSVKGEGSTVRGRLEHVRTQLDSMTGGPDEAAKTESGEGLTGQRVDGSNADLKGKVEDEIRLQIG